MRNTFTLLSALLLSVSFAAPLRAQDASTVMAEVNGVKITLGHMIAARATLPQQYQQLPDDVLFQGILDQLIQQTALAETYEGDLPLRAQITLENEERSVTAGEQIEIIMSGAVNDAVVEEVYQRDYVNVERGAEYNASHILVETEEAAAAIAEEVRGGADFAETAREKSTGPSGPNGGSLGWFGQGAMVAPFETAVMSMAAGDVSDPVQTQFGWHVIKLNEVREIPVPPLSEVQGEVEDIVRREAVESALETILEGVEVDRSGSDGIDPVLLRDISLLE